MINFRFHLVSLVAVFLALAVGVVMGSTVIDQAIVDGLRSQVDRIERKADREAAENDELRLAVAQLEGYADGVGGFAVAGRLEDVPVVVVAPRGVDGETVTALVELAQQSGALVPGILWLEERWRLESEDEVDALAEVLGVVSPRRTTTVRRDGLDALAERLAAGSALAAAAPDEPSAGDLLERLADAEFIELEQVGEQTTSVDLAQFPGAGARAVFVGATAFAPEAMAVVEPGVRALRGAEVPTVLASVHEEGDEDGAPSRADTVGLVRGDDRLSGAVSTVDDLDLRQGRVATLLALVGLADGVVGHYGYGDGASAPLPDCCPP